MFRLVESTTTLKRFGSVLGRKGRGYHSFAVVGKRLLSWILGWGVFFAVVELI